MGKTFGTVIVMIALPVVIFLGGAWLMTRWSGRPSVPGQMPLNRRWHYDAPAVESYWKALEETGGFSQEIRFLELDLIFPFFYGAALATGMLLGWAALGRAFSPAWLLAPVAITLLADWTENLAHLRGMKSWLANHVVATDWARLATTATAVKLVFFYGSLLTVIALAGMLLVRTFRVV